MSSTVKVLGVCLLSLLLVACGNRTIRAPVSTRSIEEPPQAFVFNHSASEDKTYVVRRGDTLSSIARRYDLSYKQLAEFNDIAIPYHIKIGQRLKLTRPDGTNVVIAPVRAAWKPPPKAVVPAVKAPAEPPATVAAVESVAFDGKWQWPTRGRLLRAYRPNDPGKKGIYIGGHSGQPVYAAASGKVVYVGSGLVGYGRLIIIRHDALLLSTYGHNSELLVAEGEYVKAGQIIAKMGSSSVGSNDLYFEIRKEGKPVDPSVYLPKQN